jgi:YihY family inner membrane protein
MNVIERAVRRVDRAQQGFGPAAFAFGVVKKFGDDRGGSLAALVTYYGFVSLFPLLLLLFTILALVVGGNTSFARSVEHSALANFPVVGSTLRRNITVVHRNSVPGLVISLVILVWGAQGAIQSGQFAMAQVWNVPGVVRPNFWVRLVRTLVMVGFLGIFLVLGTAAAAFASFAHGWGPVAKAGGVVLSLVLNVFLYVAAFRILTPKQVGTRVLLPGAVLGGIAWTVLQFAGTLIVGHSLHNNKDIYGVFASVLALIAWIYLGAQMTMYAAEVNVVKARRLWPRAMVQPPLTDADRRVLAAISQQAVRRPEERVHITFHPLEGEPDADDAPGGERARAGTEDDPGADTSAGGW